MLPQTDFVAMKTEQQQENMSQSPSKSSKVIQKKQQLMPIFLKERRITKDSQTEAEKSLKSPDSLLTDLFDGFKEVIKVPQKNPLQESNNVNQLFNKQDSFFNSPGNCFQIAKGLSGKNTCYGEPNGLGRRTFQQRIGAQAVSSLFQKEMQRRVLDLKPLYPKRAQTDILAQRINPNAASQSDLTSQEATNKSTPERNRFQFTGGFTAVNRQNFQSAHRLLTTKSYGIKQGRDRLSLLKEFVAAGKKNNAPENDFKRPKLSTIDSSYRMAAPKMQTMRGITGKPSLFEEISPVEQSKDSSLNHKSYLSFKLPKAKKPSVPPGLSGMNLNIIMNTQRMEMQQLTPNFNNGSETQSQATSKKYVRGPHKTKRLIKQEFKDTIKHSRTTVAKVEIAKQALDEINVKFESKKKSKRKPNKFNLFRSYRVEQILKYPTISATKRAEIIKTEWRNMNQEQKGQWGTQHVAKDTNQVDSESGSSGEQPIRSANVVRAKQPKFEVTNVKESLQTFKSENTVKPSVIYYTKEQSIKPYINKRMAKADRKKKAADAKEVGSHALDNLCDQIVEKLQHTMKEMMLKHVREALAEPKVLQNLLLQNLNQQ